MSTVLNPAKRQRAIGQGGDVYSQQISADVVPGPEPRYYTTYLTGSQGEDEGAHGEIALFQEMRTTNLVPRTSAYQIAVEKACVDTKALPSFIAQVDTGSSNPSGDVNQLQSLVGFEMNWSGSLFPSTLNGSTIAADVTVASSTTPTLYSFFSTGGSSLPIKYSRSSYGVGAFDTKKTPPAVEGVLQAYIENNPNSPYWLGQYSFNLDINVFLASFNRALVRAFGMWEPLAPEYGWLVVPTEASPGVWQFRGDYVAPQITGYDTSQILIRNSKNSVLPAEYTELHNLTVDFYPTLSWSYISGTTNRFFAPCDAKQNAFFTKFKATTGTPPGFLASVYAANPTYGSVPVAGVTSGSLTQTLPSSTQIAVPTTTNLINADNMATLTFSITTTPSGNASSVTVPCFDFYQGISSTKVQCSDATVTLPNQQMGPLYVSEQPSRTDFLTSAYLLGFVPDTVFNLAQTVSSTVFANRPLAPAFSTRIDLAAYQPLIWRPSDVYTDSAAPLPGSPYYYGYGTSYYLSNVVNPGIANCFQNEYDDYFTGDLPSKIMEKLLLKPNIDGITDLSLNGQLYCTTYFNSATAPIEAIKAIRPWSPHGTYAAGTPVTLANTDPDSPINNLYIANTLTGAVDFQSPEPFKNTDYWLYCGPFIYSTAVIGAKYMDGELVTYNGYATRVTNGDPTGGAITYSNGYTVHTFTSSGTFNVSGAPLSCNVVLIGGGGGGGLGPLGGGGGAGGAYTGTQTLSGSNTITIGAGGPGGVPSTGSGVGQNGSTTYLNSTQAQGGGGGGYSTTIAGSGGGCGGGGAFGTLGGAGAPGNRGGDGSSASGLTAGGGGGGIGGAGQNANTPTSPGGGNGGAGLTISLGGALTPLLGGGGGGGSAVNGTGLATAGGGNAGTLANNGAGSNGTANTGGGGGGGGQNNASPALAIGGTGGSGVAYIAHVTRVRSSVLFSGITGTPMTLVPQTPLIENVASGGVVTTVGAYTYHTFTGSGTFSVNTPTPLACQVMCIGGGGGGGGVELGGGGGAGLAPAISTVTVSGSNNVTVGAGGLGCPGYIEAQAVGGEISYHGDYTYHYFNQEGTFQVLSPANLLVEILVVGGGGGGGGGNSSGGGSGGEGLYQANLNLTAAEGAIDVKIGLGGAGSAVLANGENGFPSNFGAFLTARGGSGGGSFAPEVGVNGENGITGGGGGGTDTGGTPGTGGTGSDSGKNGGDGAVGAGGGGGGYGGAGSSAPADNEGGDGGTAGTQEVGGYPYYWGAGGGGGGALTGGTGSPGISGAGGAFGIDGYGGTDGTGGGGGGAGGSATKGGTGGSGYVLVCYKTNFAPSFQGQNGGTSSFAGIVSPGGGGGGGNSTGVDSGANGACGGGGCGSSDYTGTGGAGTSPPPGYPGGNGDTNTAAGGGGGMGAAGSDGDGASPANGGNGITLTLNGVTYTVAGGGGGGISASGSPGGLGKNGGGNGGSDTFAAANATYGALSGWGSGGGGSSLSNGPYFSQGGNGAPGIVVISYLTQDFVYFGKYNMLKPTPVVGTSPPLMTLNVNPGDKGDVFEIQADTYGFGTYDSKQPRDPIHAYARDSWGCLQSNATSFITNRVYDEFLLFECNTAFRDMFRGFSTTSEKYINQLNGQTSTYWIHDFILDPAETFRPSMPPSWYDAEVMNDGITQSSLRYLSSRMVSSNVASVTSPSYLRNSDAQVYFWTITSSETSRYSMWDPVQSIIIEGNTVPISTDNLPVSEPVVTQTQTLGGDSRLLLAEFFPKSNPAEGTALYEPQFPRQIYLATGTELKQFSYKISWRNKFTGEVLPLILSSVGSAMVVFMFTPKS